MISLKELIEFEEKLNKAIEDAEGEITEEVEQLLLQSEENKKEWFERLGYSLKSKEERLSNIDARIKELQDAKKRQSKEIENLKTFILNQTKGEKCYGETIVFGSRKSQSVVVQDIELLPAEFIIEKVTKSPDKKAIKDAIKNGDDVIGAILVDNVSLTVK